jgi:hypothetical protein
MDMGRWDAIKNAKAMRTRYFQDKSRITYYDTGYIDISMPAPNMDEPPRPSDADLYYWRVMQDRPEITTLEQIRETRRMESQYKMSALVDELETHPELNEWVYKLADDNEGREYLRAVLILADEVAASKRSRQD